jgi:hypothetical protein
MYVRTRKCLTVLTLLFMLSIFSVSPVFAASSYLTTVNIEKGLWSGDPGIPEDIRRVTFDFMVFTSQIIHGEDMGFIDLAGKEFILRADGYADIQATINGGFSTAARESGFKFSIAGNVVPGVQYRLLAPSISTSYKWIVSPDVFISQPIPGGHTAGVVPYIQNGVVHRPDSLTTFRTTVNRSLVPQNAKNFTRIRVMTSEGPLNIKEEGGLERYTDFSQKFKEIGYSSSVREAGLWYVLTILYDDDQHALAYREDIVNTYSSQGQSNPYGSDIDPNYNQTKASPFSDIETQNWAYSAILDLSTRKVLTGYPDGKFRPDRVVTRAEFAKIMVLAAGLTPTKVEATSFSDIKPTDWFTPFIESAKEYLNGYTSPSGKLIFDPEAPALREDIAVAIVKLKGYDKTKLADRSIIQGMFLDYQGISEFAKDYVALAVENNLVSGFPDETFKAQQPVTRAQAAAMLWRAYQVGNENKNDF